MTERQMFIYGMGAVCLAAFFLVWNPRESAGGGPRGLVVGLFVVGVPLALVYELNRLACEGELGWSRCWIP